MAPRQHLTLAVLSLVVAFMSACSREAADDESVLKSGGGVLPIQLGCEGLQANFVDDGNKYNEVSADFARFTAQAAGRLPPDPRTKDTAQDTFDSTAPEFKGVKKNVAFVGEMTKLIDDLRLPEGVTSEASCSRYKGSQPQGLYDACVEMVLYKKRLIAIADVWDNNLNQKKCFEGKNFETVRSPEFGYCDNECAFNDETCYACEVPIKGGASTERFVCKSLRSARDALSAFCRNSGSKCEPYEADKVCHAGRGVDFAGPGGIVLGGPTEELFEAALSSYVGASESVLVKAGAQAGQKLAARATAQGTIGFRRLQGVGSMFTPSGLGVSGLQVQCILHVNRVAQVTYDYSAGVGGDFIFASGEALVETGGDFKLTKAYTKSSPSFSGAGMSKDAIVAQCLNNYVMSWVGIEMEAWINQYSGLRLVQKAVQRIAGELGLDATHEYASEHVFCRYPNYDESNIGYATGKVKIWLEGADFKVMWTHLLNAWWDRSSESLTVDPESLRPFLRDIKDGTLAGDRLVQFYNEVVVPASQHESRSQWHLSSCWGGG